MAIEDLLKPEFTPGGAFKAQLDRFLASKFPFERRRTAELDAERFAAEGKTLLQTLDYLLYPGQFPDLIDRLWKRRDELTDPRPMPGEPQPWSAEIQIKNNLTGFAKWQYSGRVIDHIRGQLRPGEIIISVEPREVRTSLRTWQRAELQAACRTVTERTNRSFERQFLSEAEIDAMIVEDAKNSLPAEAPWASANRSALGSQG